MTAANNSTYGYTFGRHTSKTKKIKATNKKQEARKLRRRLRKGKLNNYENI
jgi:hypothetical protein